ncbi:MAG: hypothetical protein ACOCUU_01430 [Nanoarchaeota archaeon]
MQASLLKNNSKSFRNFFVKEFTRELIIQTYEKRKGSYDLLKLQFTSTNENLKQEIPLKKFQESQVFQESQSQESRKLNSEFAQKEKEMLDTTRFQKQRSFEEPGDSLSIPEPKIPQELSHLKPKLDEIKFNLGKLEPLVHDPNVKIIKVEGPDKKVKVVLPDGTKPTGIVLSEDEIKEVINNFSEAEKIPFKKGVVRIASGNMVLLAIVSDVVKPKFMIKKIFPKRYNEQRIYRY